MGFYKFRILDTKASNSQDMNEVEILFNIDHIISIKPIKIPHPEKLINGFWIRTTNGKKYKASQIPDELLTIIGEKYQGSVQMKEDSDEQPFQ